MSNERKAGRGWQQQVVRVLASDIFRANVAGACEAMMLLHAMLVFPLAMMGSKLAATAMLVGAIVWLIIARRKREQMAFERGQKSKYPNDKLRDAAT